MSIIKKRKPSRFISDAYAHIPKPAAIEEYHWKIWLDYNDGLNAPECAMKYHIKTFEVTQIISSVVERLKNKAKESEVWTEDFKSVEAAMEFKQRIQNNIYMAKKEAQKQGLKILLIMSEI
jgi:hypothetical protein